MGSTNNRAEGRCRGGGYRMVSADGGRKMFGPAAITHEFSKKLLK